MLWIQLEGLPLIRVFIRERKTDGSKEFHILHVLRKKIIIDKFQSDRQYLYMHALSNLRTKAFFLLDLLSLMCEIE